MKIMMIIIIIIFIDFIMICPYKYNYIRFIKFKIIIKKKKIM